MLQDFLNSYYQADLKVVHDVSGNQHLVGYSEVYHCNLFVKVFLNEAMFYAEQHVNQVYAPDIYLDTVIFEDKYVIVLRDRQLSDVLVEEVTPAMAEKFGGMLADFHNQLTGKVKVAKDARSLKEQITTSVAALAKMPYAALLNEAAASVEADLPLAQQEYEQLPPTVLHGDFSVRNIMHYQDDLILLDFEWAKMGVAFQDFIKFLYNEATTPQLKQRFILGYQKKREFEIPTKSLQRCLLLLCALQICHFHATHPKKKFGQMAQMMLQTVIKNQAVIEL